MSMSIPLQLLAHCQLELVIPSPTNPRTEVSFTLKPLPLEHTPDSDHSDSSPSLHFKSNETEGGMVIELTSSGSSNVPISYSPELYLPHSDWSPHQELDTACHVSEWNSGLGPRSEAVQAGLLLPHDTDAAQGYDAMGTGHIENMGFALDALSTSTSKTIMFSGPFPEFGASYSPWSSPSATPSASDQLEDQLSIKETEGGSEPLAQSRPSTPWSSLSAALCITDQPENKLSTTETTIPDSDVQQRWVSQPIQRTARRRPRLFPCKVPGCDRSFTSNYTRETHMLSHRPKNKHRYPCTVCTAVFSRNHDRYRHEVSQHGKRTEWECEHCVQCFSSESSLLRHSCSQAVQLQWKSPKIGE